MHVRSKNIYVPFDCLSANPSSSAYSRKTVAPWVWHPGDILQLPARRCPEPTVLQPILDSQGPRREMEAEAFEQLTVDLIPQEKKDAVEARSLLMSGKFYEAEILLRPIVDRAGHVLPVRCFLGEALRLQGKLDEAYEHLSVSKFGWSNITAILPFTVTCWALGRKYVAMKEISYICSARRGHPMPLFVRGLFHCLNGDLRAGLQDFELAEALSGGDKMAKYCVDKVRVEMKLGDAHAVDCGIDPVKIPCCIEA